jgi:N-acetylglucosamine kinase-like BadF-type ATPase
MILIADSGSTKTNWIALNNNNKEAFRVNTKGLNPAVFEKKNLEQRILDNLELSKHKNQIKKIYFYGAGCGTKTPKDSLTSVLQHLFINAQIHVNEDTLAAVYAVTKTESIVCILGTGSNCSYYDGKKVYQKIISLGYSVMDDASGNYFGRVLLRDYFFNKMPLNFAKGFNETYNLDPDDIKINLYKKENPNTYLASFSHYLIENKQSDYAQKVIFTGLRLFIENQILQYEESKTLDIHFIGSLAFFLQDEINILFKEYQLKLGKIERHPINGLVNYHLNN